MIRKILTYYTERLDEYLSGFHHCPEGMATVEQIGGNTEECPNKMVMSLLNVERETSGGISAPVQRRAGESYVRLQPPLLLNLNVILAAVFDKRQYAVSLSVLTDTLRFIQSMPRFTVEGMDYTIEIVSLSPQDLNNVWTLLGGQYYPSVVCKIRRLTLDAEKSGTTRKNVRQTNCGNVNKETGINMKYMIENFLRSVWKRSGLAGTTPEK